MRSGTSGSWTMICPMLFTPGAFSSTLSPRRHIFVAFSLTAELNRTKVHTKVVLELDSGLVYVYLLLQLQRLNLVTL